MSGVLDRRALLTTATAAALLRGTGLSAAARPKRGGRLRAALSGASASDSWDPRTHSGLFMICAGHGAVFETLTEVAADGSLRGELAQSWEARRDARRWEITLDPEARFHDGRKVTAEDVAASLLLHRDPRSRAAGIVAQIDELRVLAQHRIEIALTAPNADFPTLLADPRLIILPANEQALAIARGIGSGPYRVDLFEPGRRLLAQRVAEHPRGAWFDELAFYAKARAEHRREALLDRHADIIDAPGSTLPREFERRSVRGAGHLQIWSENADARAALRAGLDRQAMVDGPFAGAARLAADHPFSAQSRHAADPGALKNLNVRLTGTAAPLLAPVLRSSFGPEVIARLSAGRLTEDWFLSTSPLLSAHPDAALSDLSKRARSCFDPEIRRSLYAEIAQHLAERSPLFVPILTDFTQASHPRLAMPETLGRLWPLDSARLAKRWWMA